MIAEDVKNHFCNMTLLRVVVNIVSAENIAYALTAINIT